MGPSGDPLTAATSWYEEFRRLYDMVPCVEVQTLREHTDQVLHLSFSHSGYQFASCSKDCTVKVRVASSPPATVVTLWGCATQLGQKRGPGQRRGIAQRATFPCGGPGQGRGNLAGTWTSGLDHTG